MKTTLKPLIPHALTLLGLLLLAFAYNAPVLSGKRLMQHDVTQGTAAARENKLFKEKTGKESWWTNSMFGGMPTYQIIGTYPYSASSHLGSFITSTLPSPVALVFAMLAGMYLALILMGSSWYLAILGAIAYALGTYNMVIILAGHNSKVLALAYAPLIIAGAQLAWQQGKLWLGSAVFSLAMALELYANHPQITYYTFFLLGAYKLYTLGLAWKKGTLGLWFKASLLLGLGLVLAFGTHTKRFWNMKDYTPETIRGASELSAKKAQGSGLDKTYAFDWSYGLGETGTLLIPNFYGGASSGDLGGEKSKTYQVMTQAGIPGDQALAFVQQGPTYWGELSYTAGPAYAGALLVFLFIFAAIYLNSKEKYLLLGTGILYLSMAWGKYFFLNDWWFQYFPLFNKFRAVTMTLNLLQLVMVFLVIRAFMQWQAQQAQWKDIKSAWTWAVIIGMGICALLALVPDAFFGFKGLQDGVNLIQDPGLNSAIWEAIQNDRITLFRADALRSLIFMGLGALILWRWSHQAPKAKLWILALGALILVDLFSVDKRYYNADDFVSKSAYEEQISPSMADQQIAQDNAYFRVLNTTTNFMSDANTSYFHHSIGGYHGAKLRRYQEMMEKNFSGTTQMAMLNMLNTKYFIVSDSSRQLQAQQNPFALGNAWLVSQVKWAKNADEALASFAQINPATQVILEEQDRGLCSGKSAYQQEGTIQLTKYAPDELQYAYEAPQASMVVFSEIYYRGNRDWKAYIDGKEHAHVRANYILRAMEVPAGKHRIVFTFDPVSVRVGDRLDAGSSVLWLLFIAFGLYRHQTSKKSLTA